jgi:N-hydroxyarylamine O-acetyltransferase
MSQDADAPQVDLDAYFARIGYGGPQTPTLATLNALHGLHPAAIPFEAIDVLLDRGVDLSPAAIDAKLIGARRGGYCFEQNSLFQRVLMALGFEVEALIGRVLWMAPKGAAPRPRSHMVLRVTIDGVRWLADVGFGSRVLTSAAAYDEREPQPGLHDTYRLVPAGPELRLDLIQDEGWEPVYQLSPEPQADVDFLPPNWFTSTHPTSHFRHDLIVARTTPEARYTLLHNRFSTRRIDGSMDRRSLTADEMEQVLATTFGLPVEAAWRPLLERAVERGAD